MKTKQNGFAILEGLLILVIVGVLSGTGYYVWHSKQQTDKTLNSAQTESVATAVKKPATAEKILVLTYSKLAVNYDPSAWSVMSNNSTVSTVCGKEDRAELQNTRYFDLNVSFELGECGKGGGSCQDNSDCTAETKLLATVELSSSDIAYVVAEETTNPGQAPDYGLWLTSDKDCADYICGLVVNGLESNPGGVFANFQPDKTPTSLQTFVDTPEIQAAVALLRTTHYQN